MKCYLKYGLLIFLTVTTNQLSAQLKSEYVFGINLSTMTIKANGISYPTERPVGINFGLYSDIPFNRYFFLSSGFLFSAKGTDYTIDSTKISLAPIYFEVPVNAELRFGSRSFKIFVFGGPYFAVGIGGYKIVPGSELMQLRYGSGDFYDLKRFDIGYNLGTKIKTKRFIISLQYGNSLSNISPVTTMGSEIKHHVIGITFSTENGYSR